MQRIAAAIIGAACSLSAWADKYGVGEAMAEGGDDIDLGAIIIVGLVAWAAWTWWNRPR